MLNTLRSKIKQNSSSKLVSVILCFSICVHATVIRGDVYQPNVDQNFYYFQQQQYQSENLDFHLSKQAVPKQLQSTPEVNIAYCILITRKELRNSVKILDRILHPKNYYALHIDVKVPDEEFNLGLTQIQMLNQSYQNIHVLSRMQTSYAGITLVDIEIMAMAFMLEKYNDWQYFINLSATDYPLLPQSAIRRLLYKAPNNMNYITNWPADCYHVSSRSFQVRVDYALGNVVSGLRGTNKKYSRLGSERVLENAVHIYKGSQWHVITRELVDYVAVSRDNVARRWLLYFANFWIPDEHYLQTMVCNSASLQNQVVDENWHYTDWDYSVVKKQRAADVGDMGPVIISNEDQLYLALSTHKMFVRRLKHGYSEHIQDMIDEFLIKGEIKLDLSSKYQNKSVVIRQEDIVDRIERRLEQFELQEGGCRPASNSMFSTATGKLCTTWQRLSIFFHLTNHEIQ
eukprot:TRINITY_DN5224_c0_g1_i3.p2 TRINITY_DN5224_c0_g1~~TRINITY_DN5224_c0_g1_i3.p2  ORF type:complete len:491 (-),score=21.84 TRINITY_DN5224_c0_g1_i3:1644-3017(-)